MKLQINITKEILNKSKNCNSVFGDVATNCAIAEAVREIFPNAHVGNYSIRFVEPTSKGAIQLNYRSEEILLPVSACTFIYSFDNCSAEDRMQLKPFSFEIIVPDSLIEDIDISEIEEILTNSLTLQLA